MTKIPIIILSCLISGNIFAQRLKQGSSSNTWTAPCANKINKNIKDGIKYVEITINPLYDKTSEELTLSKMRTMKESIDSTRIKVWSVHLPFSRKLDISVLNDSLRVANVTSMSKIINFCSIYKPQKLVLHPSSEPITDEEREQRMKNSIRSIEILRKEATKIGAQLCIENLPRTCLGKNSEEMKQLIGNFPDVGICFDVNHLLAETQHDFLLKVGNKIKTVHISDYDFIDEKHWLPGKGKMNWGELYSDLLKTGYNRVLMFECKGEADELRNSYNYIYEMYKKYKKQKRELNINY